MDTANPQQALCDEILAQAQRESEQILQQARQQAQTLLAQASQRAEKARQETLRLARAEAARHTEQLLATVPLEIERLRLARLESWLQSIYDEARRRLQTRDNLDYRETLIALAAEAISQMAGHAFILKLSPADYASLGHDLDQAIARRLANSSNLTLTLSVEPTLTEPGLMIEDSEGHQLWDNRLSARLERMWPELRRQIALGAGLVSQSNSTGANP